MILPKKLRCVNPTGGLIKDVIYTAIYYLEPNAKCNGVQINNTKGLYILDRESSKTYADQPFFFDEDRFEEIKDKSESTNVVAILPKKDYTKRCMACADKIPDWRLNSNGYNHYNNYQSKSDKRFCSDKCETLWKNMGGVLNENS